MKRFSTVIAGAKELQVNVDAFYEVHIHSGILRHGSEIYTARRVNSAICIMSHA